MVQANQVPIATQPVPGRVNFLMELIEALNRNQISLSQQQLTDANSTMIATTMEEEMYVAWNQKLQVDDENIQGVTSQTPDESNVLTKLQLQYNYDNSQASSNESQLQGLIESGQGQTSTDAQNLQMFAQITQSATSIMSTLTSMLQSMGIIA